METKFSRLLLTLCLPFFVASCATWKPGSKDAPAPTESRAADIKPSAPAAPVPAPSGIANVPAAVLPPAAAGTTGSEIDFATSYGSVKRHGLLYTAGNRIVGEHGMPVSLAGNSFYWSQWQGAFYNADVVKWLKLDWKAAVIRVAMGIEGGGYLEHPQEEQARVCVLVDAAIAADMYVVIDWHDHHAHLHAAQAVAFFQEMARRYGQYSNVMYEIYNEPVQNTTWHDDVKPYAEKVVAAIRAIDPDNIIIVGSPNWSQDVDVAADDPIRAKNIAYSLHFYDKALKALQKGLPLFVTEWGTCNADGKGDVDEVSTREWMDFLQQWGISHCNWSVSDKDETASIVKPGSSSRGYWVESELTPSGRLARMDAFVGGGG